MIFEVNGKRIVFGMQWRSMLTEVKVHREARAAKSPYLWQTDKGIYYGLLGESDQKAKLKQPLYSGAIALLHLAADTPNVILVLTIPERKGYIICGIHQGRPRHGCDVIVEDETEVHTHLRHFHQLCGSAGQYTILGDLDDINGMKPLSLEELAKAADSHAQLKRTRSALINPMVMAASAMVVGAGGVIAWNEYSLYRAAQLREQTLASAKNTQQVYDEEIQLRRAESTVSARDASALLTSIRSMEVSRGGWNLELVDCNVQSTKLIKCTYGYVRSNSRWATYEAFLNAAGTKFDVVEFAGDKITAIRDIRDFPFSTAGVAIDHRKAEREEVIEFGSLLQSFSNMGKHSTTPFTAYALPPGADLTELSSPPILASTWVFNAPLRGMEALDAFPRYATVSRVAVTITNAPQYTLDNSLAMTQITGVVFAKPN